MATLQAAALKWKRKRVDALFCEDRLVDELASDRALTLLSGWWRGSCSGTSCENK